MNYAYGVVGTNFKINTKKTHKKAYFFVSLFVISALCATVVFYPQIKSMFAQTTVPNNEATTIGDQVQTGQADSVSPDRALANTAEAALRAGDKKLAEATYDQALASSPDDEARGVVELQRSESYATSGDFESALAAALSAEAYFQSSRFLMSAVSTAAGLYVELGRVADAKQYYTKMIQLIDADSSQGYDQMYYADQLSALEAS